MTSYKIRFFVAGVSVLCRPNIIISYTLKYIKQNNIYRERSALRQRVDVSSRCYVN